MPFLQSLILLYLSFLTYTMEVGASVVNPELMVGIKSLNEMFRRMSGIQ